MKTEKIALSGLIACLTLSGLALTGAGCAGNRLQRSTGAYLDDKSISTRVKTALFRDPAVSGFDVKVNTFRGDVQLSGFVDTPEQKDRAATIAREIPGVALVTNNLEVKPSDPAVGSPGPGIEQRSGTINQPIPERPALDQPTTFAPVRTPGSDPDRSVADPNLGNRYNNVAPTASQPLSTAPLNSQVSPESLHIDSYNGRATLRGTVNSDIERQDIERRVRDIPGISSVDNQLKVQSPVTR